MPEPGRTTTMSITTRTTLARKLDAMCRIEADIIALLAVIGDCPLLVADIRDRAELHAMETRAQRALLERHRLDLQLPAAAVAATPSPATRCEPLYARSGEWLLARWDQLERLEIEGYQGLIACVAHTDLPELLSGCASALDLQRSLVQWLSPLAQATGEQDANPPVMQGAANALQESAGAVHP